VPVRMAVAAPVTVIVCAAAVTLGGELTVTVTVAGVAVPLTLVATYMNVSVPEKPVAGV